MSTWIPCPDDCLSPMNRNVVQQRWSELHQSDGLAWPGNPALQEGWRLYH